MLKAIWKEFIPNKVVLLRSNLESDEVAEVAPFTKHYVSLNEAPTVYVCQKYKCKLPTTDIHEMLKLLGSEN